ncbi:hypothetical protein GCK72_011272 [Caenorhabditis remanei]|uniref:DUF38 domain-containing protein n=1 Tax=Caenorhabditis remanei TaxID=31234 RepID=A0A6A5H741_CAERE|nr:hypothetical protein GCK72_011272 [Caenorhabditis remanei]KAF1763007.1 hypothetical protein GCK72_011272 [Caenorhabditis remanei]
MGVRFPTNERTTFLKPAELKSLFIVNFDRNFRGIEKQLYLACPAIRKQEDTIPYNFERIEIGSSVIKIDKLNVKVSYDEIWQTNCCEWYDNGDKEKTTALPEKMSVEDAAEKLFMFYMNRPGTNIKKFIIKGTRVFLPKCIPLNIEKLNFGCSNDAPAERYLDQNNKTGRPFENMQYFS